MQVSKRYLALLQQQLAQFTDRPDLRSLVVYLALPTSEGKPSLVPVGAWPPKSTSLPAVENDPNLQLPEAERRWLALRQDQRLLGALRVEIQSLPWPEPLNQRLQATAQALTQGLCLDLEQQRLNDSLQRQDQQLQLLIHQLRNPLAALRTFGQLLWRRLETDPPNRALVEGLLAEEQQLNRYVEAIDGLASQRLLSPGPSEPRPLLLPPSLAGNGDEPLAHLLDPLLQRAAATAALQGRTWQGPGPWPAWRGDTAAVAEILANLLENAFRYSPVGAPLGLHVDSPPGRLRLCVWDGGQAIAPAERDPIFERGVRGVQGLDKPGTGLGLALARDLARDLEGELRLVVPPRELAEDLPAEGNAFCLELPNSPGP